MEFQEFLNMIASMKDRLLLPTVLAHAMSPLTQLEITLTRCSSF